MQQHGKLEKFTHIFSKWVGSGGALTLAAMSLVGWLIAGQFHAFSEQWSQAFTVYIESITFLMLFLIQRTDNKELAAIQVKLNELIAATEKADNRLVRAEVMSEEEIETIQKEHDGLHVESGATAADGDA